MKITISKSEWDGLKKESHSKVNPNLLINELFKIRSKYEIIEKYEIEKEIYDAVHELENRLDNIIMETLLGPTPTKMSKMDNERFKMIFNRAIIDMMAHGHGVT